MDLDAIAPHPLAEARKYLNEQNGAKIVALHQDNSSKEEEEKKMKNDGIVFRIRTVELKEFSICIIKTPRK